MAPRKTKQAKPATKPVEQPAKRGDMSVEDATELLARWDLELGMTVAVDGVDGEFVIRSVSHSGAVWCYSKHGARAFRPEWCYPASVVGPRGGVTRGRLPEERRGMRDAWLAEHWPSGVIASVED